MNCPSARRFEPCRCSSISLRRGLAMIWRRSCPTSRSMSTVGHSIRLLGTIGSRASGVRRASTRRLVSRRCETVPHSRRWSCDPRHAGHGHPSSPWLRHGLRWRSLVAPRSQAKPTPTTPGQVQCRGRRVDAPQPRSGAATEPGGGRYDTYVTIAYDAGGRRTSMIDGVGTETNSYFTNYWPQTITRAGGTPG